MYLKGKTDDEAETTEDGDGAPTLIIIDWKPK